jgi:hypothetical protein
VRYNKFKKFIFQDNQTFSYGSTNYNILDNELLLFQSSLTLDYFTNVITNRTNNFNETFDTLGYYNSKKLDSLKKLTIVPISKSNTTQKDILTILQTPKTQSELISEKIENKSGVGEEGEGNLMAWVQSKITNAVEMLDGVSDYLKSEHKTASDKNKGKKLNKPFRTPGGPKKFSVYVKNDKGNIIKVNFGDPHLSIKRDNPNRRKNFRARHNCDNPGPKTKARYWSCRNWEAGRSVSDNLKGK